MKLFMKYKHLIVSFGLLPIIITLTGLHFFPNTLMLGIGLAISIAGLYYDISRLKRLNFFLLQGTVGIGACFILRLLTGYNYIPPRSITPTLEFMLLVCAFIYATVPEAYKEFLKRFHLNTTFSYVLEAKVIVILSGIHLLGLFLFQNRIDISNPSHFFLVYYTPMLIYVICLLLNITGIRMAATHERLRCLIRIAPICNGKIYLCPHQTASESIWDIPMNYQVEGLAATNEKFATKQSGMFLKEAKCTIKHFTSPRLILKYHIKSLAPYPIQLFILPIANETDIQLKEGRFFSFYEIEKTALKISNILMAEKEHLQISANIWKKFTCK